MPVDNSPMSIRQHSPSCTMILLILRSPCTQPSLSGTRSRKRCRYRLSSSLTPVMFACAAAFCETKRCFVSLRLAAFFYSLRKPFLPACMKTAVLSTAVSLCLRSGVLDVCLRCCFLRDETLFRVATPCGFFLQPAQAVFISLYENSRLVDGCFIVFTLWGF